MLPIWSLVLRIAVGGLLGGAIGFERDIHGRPVGFRTHMVVGMAAATFMVVSAHFLYLQHYGDGDHVGIDPSRIAASVVTGIGFLAAGAIFKAGATVQGLTTAAALWLVTAIGLAAGSGMYVIALSATAMGILALWILRLFEGDHAKGNRRAIWLEISGNSENVQAIMDRLEKAGVAVSEFDYTKTSPDKVEVEFEVRVRPSTGIRDLIQMMEQEPDVRQVRVRVPK